MTLTRLSVSTQICVLRYVASCVTNMGKGGHTAKRGMFSSLLGGRKQKTAANGDHEAGQYFGSFKYTAAKLKDKGVLISVDNVPDSKLGLIKIEISSDEVGVFQFKVCCFVLSD